MEYSFLATSIALIWIPFFVTPILLLLAIVGLMWSPFAALISWRMAGNRGLSGSRYAITGAVYSMLLVLPWIYMVMALRCKRISTGLVDFAYFFLYMAWLVGPIAFMYLGFVFFAESTSVVAIGVLTALVLAWMVSLAILVKSWLPSLFEVHRSSRGREPILDLKHIMPFGLVVASTGVSYLLSHTL